MMVSQTFRPAKLFLLGLIATLAAACTTLDEAQEARQAADFIIENVTAIDAKFGRRENVDVIVAGPKIIAVGPDIAAEYIAQQTVDGTDRFLIPGLWDAHVHLSYAQGIDHKTFFPLALAHGVTSLRDTGGQLEQLQDARATARDPSLLTPDFYISGPLIDGSNRVYDGSSRGLPDLSVGVSGSNEARARVKELAAAGADFIKAYEMLSPQAYQAVVEASRDAGLPVALHPPLSLSLEQVIAMGPGDIQHLRNVELACASNADELHRERIKMLSESGDASGARLRTSIHSAQRVPALKDQDDARCNEIILAMARAGMVQTPTLVVSTFPSERLYAEPEWRKSWDMMPSEVAEGWRTRSSAFLDSQPTEDHIRYAEWMRNMIPRMRRADIPFMAGTDAPIGYLTPGASLHEELRLLVEFGLTPIQAIEAATLTPASFFGLEKKQGTIAEGMRADLVLLTKDPLADIRYVSLIESVVKDGCLIDRASLDLLLNSQRNKAGSPFTLHCRM